MSLNIDRVQLIGISEVKTVGRRLVRYLTVATGSGGMVQIALIADEWIGDTEDHMRKRLEIVHLDSLPPAPKHDEGDCA